MTGTLRATLSEPFMYKETFGDTWFSTRVGDGRIVSISCDTKGWREACGKYGSNLALSEIRGDLTRQDGLDGETFLSMREHPYDFGAWGTYKYDEDGIRRMWKANDIEWINGALYMSVSRHSEMKAHTRYRQDAVKSSIIKSEDMGKTWSRTEDACYYEPMFSGSLFSVPCFVKYGDGDPSGNPHGADKYVYMMSNEGFWNNGSSMYLARVPRDRFGNLSPEDWEFYCKDFPDAPEWTKDPAKKRAVLADPFKCSMAGAQYVAPMDRYIMTQAYYPEPYSYNFDTTKTCFRFYESKTPWGPWNPFFDCDFDRWGFYTPSAISCSVAGDRNECSMLLLTAGDWQTCMAPDTVYRLSALNLTLRME